MATSTIISNTVKTKTFEFTNLAQYTPQSYYLYIPGVKSKAGIPSNAKIIGASLSNWFGLGPNPNAQMSGDDTLVVFFTQGWTISSESRVLVRFVFV